VRRYLKKIFHKISAVASLEFHHIRRGIQSLRFFQLAGIPALYRHMRLAEKIIAGLLLIIIVADLGYLVHHSYIDHSHIEPSYGGSYTEGMVGGAQYINPLLAQSQTDKSLSNLVYSGLYKYDDRGNLVPDLAASLPVISSNQRQFTITLKPNLTWQDGNALTADDVVFTIQAIQNPNYQSPYLKDWQNTTVKKIDAHTVELDNQDISAPFINNFTIGILPQHLWKNVSPGAFANSGLNLEPIGSGPFAIKEISRDSTGQINKLTFSAFKNYAGGQPYIQTVNIKFYPDQSSAVLALHSNQIEAFGYTPFDQTNHFGAKTDLRLSKISTYSYQAVFFNTGINGDSAVLGDHVVRAALTEATDRQSLINNIYNGQAETAYGPFGPSQIGYDPSIQNINPFNVSAANTALDADGWTRDAKTGMRMKKNVALAFTVTTNDFTLNQQLATALQKQWAQVGANVSVKILSTADLTKVIQSRSYQALLFSENPGFDPDPFVFWHSSQVQNPGLNLSAYKNTAADKLISAARSTFDGSTRIKDYQQFQQVLLTDAPAVFLLRPDYIYVQRASLQGLQINQLANPQDRFYDIVHWYVKAKRVFNR
jgi:peptide/nickel transport system substrate-binding protein